MKYIKYFRGAQRIKVWETAIEVTV
jgi:hypothetical protein